MTGAPAFAAPWGLRQPGEAPPRLAERPGAVARTVDIIVVAVTQAGGSRALYGLLVSQVHSIVRLDAREGPGRVRRGSDGWELAADGGWMPLLPLPALLAHDARRDRWPAFHGVARALALKGQAGPDRGRRVGLLVDDVVEIVSAPLSDILPFPAWMLRGRPGAAVWGGLAREGAAAVPALLLLLDGVALAGRALER
jgi:chemotaxis signal transduction protein